jgi:hypothetical protein
MKFRIRQPQPVEPEEQPVEVLLNQDNESSCFVTFIHPGRGGIKSFFFEGDATGSIGVFNANHIRLVPEREKVSDQEKLKLRIHIEDIKKYRRTFESTDAILDRLAELAGIEKGQ